MDDDQEEPLLPPGHPRPTRIRTRRRRVFPGRVIFLLSCSTLTICLWFYAAGCGIQDVVAPASSSSRCPSSVSSVMMRLWIAADFLFAFFKASPVLGYAASSTPLMSYPLAVKNPFFSTWVPGYQLADAANAKAQFWTGSELTWPVLAHVANTTYVLFGGSAGLPSDVKFATTDGVKYTSTHTYISLTAGDVKFTLDFFTPVYPKAKDYVRQSLPYSYLTVNATTSGMNSQPNIQIMSALDHSWTAQNGAAGLSRNKSGNSSYFQFHNPNEIHYTENNSNDFGGTTLGTNMATYGKIIFASKSDLTGTTLACSSAATIFSRFSTTGKLAQTSGSCGNGDLAAIVKDVSADGWNAWSGYGPWGYGGTWGDWEGRNTQGNWSSTSTTFAVGFERENTILYLGSAQTGYHRTKWPTVSDAVAYVLDNYEEALADSLSFDALVRSKTESVSSQFGSQYADICEASVRQSFASMELTVPANNMATSPWVFLKEISSDGNMNTVDLIFQSWPIFINLNPEWIILQFVPILEYIASGRWPKEYTIHDMGARYPNATGHDNGKEEAMPLFETSSILILMYAYQKFSGDSKYTTKYQDLLHGWANYIINSNALYPPQELISVDAIPASANQTALAMQSAIGLKAASVLLNNQTYANVANSWAKTIYNNGLGLDANKKHFTYNYGIDTSWNVIFTAFSDVLLNLNTFPQSAWNLQSDWYLSQMQEGGLAFAGSLTDHPAVNWALTDWNIMTASTMSPTLQNAIVNTTWHFMTNGKNSVPFGTKYIVSGPRTGEWIGNKARGTVGTHFAITALQQGLWSY